MGKLLHFFFMCCYPCLIGSVLDSSFLIKSNSYKNVGVLGSSLSSTTVHSSGRRLLTALCSPGYNYVASSCKLCNLNYYCDGVSSMSCPNGSTTSSNGSISISNCLCPQGYAFNSSSVYNYLPSVSQGLVSLIRTCNNALCSVSARDYFYLTGGWGPTSGLDGNMATAFHADTTALAPGSYKWFRIDFETARWITSGTVYAYTGGGYEGRLDRFQIWIGNDVNFPGTNQLLYYSSTVNVVTESFKSFAYGRYFYIAKNISEILMIAEVNVFGDLVANCAICPLGMVCATSNAAIPCSSGSYCPVGSTAEQPCPAGYYCASPSLKVACQPGSYCPAGSTSELLCPDCIVSGNIPVRFNYSGSVVQWQVPSNVYSINVKMWGGGGGGALNEMSGNYYAGHGGSGGYTYGTIPVNPNSYMYILVGGGGGAPQTLTTPFGDFTKAVYNAGAWPNGGGCATAYNQAGGFGGGRSQISIFDTVQSNRTTAVRILNNIAMIAGGGGGGAPTLTTNTEAGKGRSGGGIVGNQYSGFSVAGKQSLDASCTKQTTTSGLPCQYIINGEFLTGGDINGIQPYMGAGGDGYYGGSCGAQIGSLDGGGAGGSGYLNSYIVNGATVNGNDSTSITYAASSAARPYTDPANDNFYGYGGLGYTSRTALMNGKDGFVYMSYSPCSAGYYLLNSICTACPLGKYSTTLSTSCITCPNGYITLNIATTSSTQCICPSGMFDNGGSGCVTSVTTTAAPLPETTTAAPLPVTTTAALLPVTTTAAPLPVTTTAAPLPVTTTAAPLPVTTTAAPLPVTTTAAPLPVTTTAAQLPVTTTAVQPSTSSSVSVYPCPTGSYCADSSTIVACSQGSYCPYNSTAQKPCPLGSYCINPSTIATCDSGFYCPSGSTSQQPCPTGMVCGVAVTTICSPGYNYVASSCKLCDLNYYCDGVSSTSCPPGSTTSSTGSISISDCQCPQGYTFNSSSVYNATQEIVSLIRTCNNALCSVTALDFYIGTGGWGPTSGLDGNLATGYHADTTLLAPGSYKWFRIDFESTRWITGGTVYAYTGGTGYEGRLDGFQIWIGNDVNFPGTNRLLYYSKTVFVVTESFNVNAYGRYLYIAKNKTEIFMLAEVNVFGDRRTCAICPSGKVCATSNAAIPCSLGSYCPRGSIVEKPCPLGSYCTNSSVIVACQLGSYCPSGSTSALPCPSGFFCINASSQETCPPLFDCPSGTFSNLTCAAGYTSGNVVDPLRLCDGICPYNYSGGNGFVNSGFGPLTFSSGIDGNNFTSFHATCPTTSPLVQAIIDLKYTYKIAEMGFLSGVNYFPNAGQSLTVTDGNLGLAQYSSNIFIQLGTDLGKMTTCYIGGTVSTLGLISITGCNNIDARYINITMRGSSAFCGFRELVVRGYSPSTYGTCQICQKNNFCTANRTYPCSGSIPSSPSGSSACGCPDNMYLKNGTCKGNPGYISPYVYTFDGTGADQFANPYPNVPFTLTKSGYMNPMTACYYTGRCFETWGQTGASIQFPSFNSSEMTIGFFFKIPASGATVDPILEFTFGTKYLRVAVSGGSPTTALSIVGNSISVTQSGSPSTIPPFYASYNSGPFSAQGLYSMDWRHMTVVLNTTQITVYINGGVALTASQANSFFGTDFPNVKVFGSFMYYDHLIIIPSFLSQDQVTDFVASLIAKKSIGAYLCPAKSYCVDGVATSCPNGTSCAAGSSQPTCIDPMLTFANGACRCSDGKLVSGTTCTLCPAGMMCTSTSDPISCSSGSYCPAGSSSAQPCPAGTYCATAATSIACQAGSYCPSGSIAQTLCPIGSYCVNSTSVIACTTGSFCPAGSALEQQCPAGFYCSSPGNNASCAAGSYCPPGSTLQQACTAGYYCSTPATMTVCQPGSYCLSGSTSQQQCSAGFYCVDPLTTVACQTQGSYCPSGSTSEQQCTAGFYCSSPATRVACTQGSYCPVGSIVSQTCPVGSYCASPSTIAVCQTGTYCPPGSTSAQQCPAGMVCASSVSSLSCSSGSYCPVGSTAEQPCPAGSYCTTPASISVCSVGSYCPLNSTSDMSCPAGSYCANTSTIAGCPANYYCQSGSTAPTSCGAGLVSVVGSTSVSQCEVNQISLNITIDNVNPQMNLTRFQAGLPSNIVLNSYQELIVWKESNCPRGSYCVNSTSPPVPCPAGTYNSLVGQDTPDACFKCPVGQYCPSNSTLPTDCAAGSYRMTEMARNQGDCTACPSGNYCPLKSVTPINCTAGTYQPDMSASVCLDCPAGGYCPAAASTVSQCSAGTYSSATGAVDITVCVTCPAGNYCPSGAVGPTNCIAGTYSASPAARNASSCLACPTGRYCPLAATTPINCNAGSYRSMEGGVSQSSCTLCPAGGYCPAAASTVSQCTAGTYSSATGAVDITFCVTCPSGNYCPLGAVGPTNCTSGTYRASPSAPNASSCLACPAGQYCPLASTTPINCDAGSYRSMEGGVSQSSCTPCPVGGICPAGAISPNSCAAGKYNPGNASTNSSACVSCPAGNYCPVGATAPTKCPAGTYRTALEASSLIGCQTCPAGSYCVEESTAPVQCVSGTYRSSIGGNSSTSCSICPSGQYCEIGTGNPSSCAAGTYYPFTGAQSSSDCILCPAGRYCLSASINPTNCSAGTYNSLSGQDDPSDCQICPVGKFCDTAAIAPSSCLAGTYRNTSGAESQSQCSVCTPGHYCPASSVDPIDCAGGTYNTLTGQVDSTKCLQCTAGQYCPNASIVPLVCSAGTYNGLPGQSDPSACQVCPVGKYCDAATAVPYSCSAGTYRNTTGAQSQSECSVCTLGHYCPASSVNPLDCAGGTYNALTGQGGVAGCLQCTAGHYCPNASSIQLDCTAGTYTSLSGQDELSDCVQCPPGYFCPGAAPSPSSCAAGSFRGTPGAKSQAECSNCTAGNYCPASSTSPTNCSAGTYNGLTMQPQASSCKPCPAGQFCPIATTIPSACAAGTFRTASGASSQDNCTACPLGNYCPIQTINPIQCAAGTYNSLPGGTNNSVCLQCSMGKYSITGGRSTDCPYCPAGSYCTSPITTQLCPAHTTSDQGSTSLLNCRCMAGFQCSYTKQITATVTLNTTYSSFTGDVDGIQTAFKAQVAAAAGVSPSQVVIKNVAPKLSGRRLLGLHTASKSESIDVRMVVNGAERLHNLYHHLAKHDPYLYQGHVWAEAHSVSSQPLMYKFRLFS